MAGQAYLPDSEMARRVDQYQKTINHLEYIFHVHYGLETIATAVYQVLEKEWDEMV